MCRALGKEFSRGNSRKAIGDLAMRMEWWALVLTSVGVGIVG